MTDVQSYNKHSDGFSYYGHWVDTSTYAWEPSDYKLNQYSLSVNTQIAPKWNVIAEAVTNNVGTVENADKHGVWTRVTYVKMDWKTSNDWQMYGEYFDIPKPDDVVFAGWFSGGEVFRSGCTFTRGYGKIFYFQPGHEEYPVYYMPQIQKIIKNAVRYLAPARREKKPADCIHAEQPYENGEK